MRQVPVPLLSTKVRVAGAAGVLLVIVYFSLFTAAPQQPSRGPLWDKKLHFAAYAGLAAALTYATVQYRARPAMRIGLIFGGTIGVGVAIELVQGTLSTRYFGWGDLLANMLGAGVILFWLAIEHRVDYIPAQDVLTDLV